MIITNDGVPVSSNINNYGTVGSANTYFGQRLNSTVWTDASDADKLKALIEATRSIDRLRFKGAKADDDQLLQFPRGTDVAVPTDIQYATYELAIVLLDGTDPNLEIENLAITSHGYSPVRTTYDRTFAPENIQAGIPSPRAWAYLKPYLGNPLDLTLSRVT